MAARVGKHTDVLIEELVVSSEGKTAGKRWNSDDWGGYERVLPPEILHHGKDLHATVREDQRNCQTTNGTLASQTEYERLAGESFLRQLSQVWQGVGTNKGDHSISSELLQLDLAA